MVNLEDTGAYHPRPQCQDFLITDFAYRGGLLQAQVDGRWVSGVVGDERASVSGIDFLCLPGGAGALVPEFESGVGSGFIIVSRNPESKRGWPAKVDQWARSFESPAPPRGLTLRAPAWPAFKTPPIPRRFSMWKGGAGGGGRLISG